MQNKEHEDKHSHLSISVKVKRTIREEKRNRDRKPFRTFGPSLLPIDLVFNGRGETAQSQTLENECIWITFIQIDILGQFKILQYAQLLNRIEESEEVCFKTK